MQILTRFANNGGWDYVGCGDYQMIAKRRSCNFSVARYLYNDLICKRSPSIIKRCLASENDLVSFVSHYGVLIQ